MEVLYSSEADHLQIMEIEDLLDYMLKHNAQPELLRNLSKQLDTQGFFQGISGNGSFSVTSLNLPRNNILILSDEELEALYSYAIITEQGIPTELLTIHAKSAWLKIGWARGMLHNSKREKKDA